MVERLGGVASREMVEGRWWMVEVGSREGRGIRGLVLRMDLGVGEEAFVGGVDVMRRSGSGVLEKCVSGVKKVGRAIKDEMSSKAYWVDTLTGMSFWMPMMTANERLVQDWLYDDPSSWSEIGAARLVGVPVGMGINRKMTQFRDYWSEKLWKVKGESSFARKTAADLSLALTVIPTLYTLVLGAAGESLEEIGQMVPSGTAIQMGMAFVYAQYLTASRKIFGTTPDYLLKDDE